MCVCVCVYLSMLCEVSLEYILQSMHNPVYIGQTLRHHVHIWQNLRHLMANFMPKWTPSFVRLIKLNQPFIRVSDFKS